MKKVLFVSPVLTRLLVSAIFSGAVFAPASASALNINLNGQVYRIFTATGSLPDNQPFLEKTPWFGGDSSISREAAFLVGDSLGLFNDYSFDQDQAPNVGPFFVYEISPGEAGDPAGQFRAHSYNGPNSPFNLCPDSICNTGTFGGLGATLISTWAFAEPVPGPLPILGVAAAFGYSRKLRKHIKTSNPEVISTTAV
jgi:hypothetical protein